jgi:hypothetical protein
MDSPPGSTLETQRLSANGDPVDFRIFAARSRISAGVRMCAPKEPSPPAFDYRGDQFDRRKPAAKRSLDDRITDSEPARDFSFVPHGS